MKFHECFRFCFSFMRRVLMSVISQIFACKKIRTRADAYFWAVFAA